MAFGQYSPNPVPTNNNWWFGNNYSSGYSQASRSPMYQNPMNPSAQMNQMSPMMGGNLMQPAPVNPQQMMQQGNMQQQMPVNNILQVMGPESAMNYLVGPNSRVILMDSNRPVFYMKQSDDSSYAETKAYAFYEIPLDKVNEITSTPSVPTESQTKSFDNYITKEDFDKFKKEIEELVINNA